MNWKYGFVTVRGFSNALGVLEVAIAILIGLRPWSARASALGSAGAVLMFLTTLSFLFSTPGWEPPSALLQYTSPKISEKPTRTHERRVGRIFGIFAAAFLLRNPHGGAG
jgi:Protein of unknown function, DUF417